MYYLWKLIATLFVLNNAKYIYLIQISMMPCMLCMFVVAKLHEQYCISPIEQYCISPTEQYCISPIEQYCISPTEQACFWPQAGGSSSVDP